MLTSKQRSFLRSLGNEMEPILIVGKGGITEKVIEQLDQALLARELVKARILPHTDFNVKEYGLELASRTESEVVQTVGRNILFYRKPTNGNPRKITFPGEI